MGVATVARSSRGVVAAPSEAAFQLLMASVNMRTGDCILHSLPPCGACLTHTVFYWPPLHIYRIEAVAAKPDQDAERVGALHAAGTKNAQASHELVAVKWIVSG